ncbi:hypothetical protein EDD86DRAFT_219899 [Gorgonomyces haynaldii]|nr:hypothetical protein EDD86DRAFT_219899 [Gorgonomyces haynaldii]
MGKECIGCIDSRLELFLGNGQPRPAIVPGPVELAQISIDTVRSELLPPQLAKMIVLPRGQRLSNVNPENPEHLLPLSKEHETSLVGTKIENLRWVNNGTHVLNFAQIAYHTDVTIYGFIYARFDATFKEWDYTGEAGKFSADMWGAIVSGTGGTGTCWFNYNVRDISAGKWRANVGSFGVATVGGAVTFGFGGQNGEDLGNCVCAIAGISLNAGSVFALPLLSPEKRDKFTYTADIRIIGFVSSRFTAVFYENLTNKVGQFDVDLFGPRVPDIRGSGTCYFNYNVADLVAQKWSATLMGTGLVLGGDVTLKGEKGEDIGFCSLNVPGFKIPFGPGSKGTFS